jgi:HK97 family phage major capsid protein
MNGVSHSPFSRIKSMFADITEDEARAKGYMKGNRKKEEVFTLLKRTTTPATIYKKQKLDRDDIIDITDFDVVSWIKTEMRMMLNEEIARAVLFGDGRLSDSEDKIPEANIRPIYNDDKLYTISYVVTPEADESLSHAIISGSVAAQDDYQGSGNLTAFMPASVITPMLLMETLNGTRLYPTLTELAAAMNVDQIVKLPKGICPDGTYGLIVDLKDYNVGADKGGEINMFDDFDIDYNQQKYLMETRCSGALVKPYSAIVLTAKTAEVEEG